jgi:uncharacterized protein YndB with AHSA1/START domain
MTADILHAVQIEADPAIVYRAITTQEGEAAFWTRDNEITPETGSMARFGFPGSPVDLKMRIDTLNPDRMIEWSCEGDFPSWAGTKVSWMLEAKDGGTALLFRHGGWPKGYPEGDWAGVNFVWGQVVSHLKAYAETGRPAPFFP